MMRFSLLTLMLVALWCGTAGLVHYRWAPWAQAPFPNGESILSKTEYPKHYPTWPQESTIYQTSKSPDGTRSLSPAHGGYPVYFLSDLNEGEILCMLPPALGFVDDNRIVCIDGTFSSAGEFSYKSCFLMHRRHPEWWWGHFYRPEVWLLVVLTIVLSWRFVKAIRARRQPQHPEELN